MDLVITVCDNAAGEVCPFWPDQPATEHWGSPDPSNVVGSDAKRLVIQIDFAAVRDVGKRPQGLVLTVVINGLIKPFAMAALRVLFFRVLFADWVDPQSASEYTAGMLLLGVTDLTVPWETLLLSTVLQLSLVAFLNRGGGGFERASSTRLR